MASRIEAGAMTAGQAGNQAVAGKAGEHPDHAAGQVQDQVIG
ncbi:hypothetical protein [Neomoorella glycerini]|nr:hypothetical protein [Moorella glycerini]